MIAFCKDKQRRDLVLQTAGVNGLDYLEVLGSPGCGNQLALTFLKDARGLSLTPANIAVSGDTVLQVTGIVPATDEDPLTITVQLSGTGDFSPYTLALVAGATNPDPPAGIDPQLYGATFSFKAGCPTPVDCLAPTCCPATPAVPPDIHYLARDFTALRQAMLDRIAVLVPSWNEVHEADPLLTLVEALAYAADRISYLQDAVNTEAYIGTARSRISLRRHARLVDYSLNEGCNARAWVCLTTQIDGVTVPAGSQFFPLTTGLSPAIDPNVQVEAAAQLQGGPGPVFESMAEATLYTEQNRMEFYTWGDGQCCLPVGTTQATLTGEYPHGAFASLAAGQVLIFEEVLGPATGNAADADPAHRWAVRLTAASTVDATGQPLVDPVNPGVLLTHIEWNSDDALPFPLCLSALTDGGTPLAGVSVARGNVVATDQGVWISNECVGVVPPAPPAPVTGTGCNCALPPGALVARPRFTPTLAHQPLTFAAAYDTQLPAGALPAASSFLHPDMSTVTAQIALSSDDGQSWLPTTDLLSKDAEYAGFIPEIEWDGSAHLRFGDGTYGAAPQAGVSFSANYRIGNGAAGNVGREALAHVLISTAGISGVRNPLAAAGGVNPETMQHIVQVAPFAFQTQMRCVTAADYGTAAAALNGVRAAQGTLRWTGSWYSALISIDPLAAWSGALAATVTAQLDMLRMLGTDLLVEEAVFVGLNIGLKLCVAPGFFQGDVYQAVWQVLVTGDTCTAVPGLLNAGNFQFGQTVYVSPIIAAAQAVPGVAAITLVAFERMDSPTPAGTAPPTQLSMAAVEIPCCDNDPNHADHGRLTLIMDGGK